MQKETGEDTLERLERLREAVKNARDEKVRLDERLKAKAEERAAILAELKEAGVSEGELESTITKLSQKLEAELTKAEQVIASAEVMDPVAAAAAEDGGEFTQGAADDLDDDLA